MSEKVCKKCGNKIPDWYATKKCLNCYPEALGERNIWDDFLKCMGILFMVFLGGSLVYYVVVGELLKILFKHL